MSEPITVQRGICGEDETAPEANADVSPTTVAPNETVTFDASGSTDNLDVEGYEWDFGDGSEPVTGETVTHAYAENGSYEAHVDRDRRRQQHRHRHRPGHRRVAGADEAPTAVLDAPESVTAGEPATFDASDSTDDEGIVEYQWTVDGTSVDAEGPTLEHNFPDAGNHTVGVTVVDESDQTSSTTAEVTVEAAPDAPPTAAASADPTTVAPGEPVAFDGTASTDDGEITAYEWAFGDGNGSDGATASHAYASAGEYEATLTVTDDAGNTNFTTVPVIVEAEETEAPDEAPTAALTAPESSGVGETVTFDAGDSADDNRIVEYQWEIDGALVDASGETLEESFLEPGDHTATVTVVDATGQNDSASATVTVGEVLDEGSDEEDDTNESDDADDSDDSDSDDSDDESSDDDSDAQQRRRQRRFGRRQFEQRQSEQRSPSSGGSSGGAALPADGQQLRVSPRPTTAGVVTVENAAAGGPSRRTSPATRTPLVCAPSDSSQPPTQTN